MIRGGDTIAAIATAPGRGGIAVVRVSGPDAFSVAAAVTGRRIDGASAGRFFRVRFRDANGPLDEGLVLVFAAPRSYTGEDAVEFQTHGGAVVPRRVLEASVAAGARLARPGEFSLRAFLNGKLDLSEAEAVIDLVDARTERAADDAFARLAGALSGPLEALYDRVLALSSRLEHALDVDEGELPDGFAAGVRSETDGLLSEISLRLSGAREGRLLRTGARVVLAGPPNAGKSSLLNALLGEARAIVSDEAGTTRDAIEGTVDWGGWPVILTDTAGLRAAADAVEREGVARAEKLIAEADVVIRLVETRADASAAGPRDVVVQSKGDLRAGTEPPPGILRVSARTGEGLDGLRRLVTARLAADAAKPGEANGADVTTRQAEFLERAAAALRRANAAGDWTVAANEVRAAAETLGEVLGKTYSADLLDALFSRFCVGK